ncbi:universal stress protein [Oceanomicrobium pacificus]|uniref:Universal stress protein n=1 Tax=Oceanomicrobium pacificus TaxID=2692916 RepID=A0A6B0TU44_9RHOB|nr:universal stress protein [Oceanomicrobium pacificus]MXU64483.1 universal stress protein [Oceanomicrobium pacificus]
MRKFLVVMDDSPEFLNALRFAAIRANKTGGAVEILGIIAPEEFQHWIGVAETMRAEARERIEEHFTVFAKWMQDKEGLTPELVIREGEKVTEVLAQIREDPEIGVLVLGAGARGDGPGPLVSQLAGRMAADMKVPVTVVPGSMSKEDIIAVS